MRLPSRREAATPDTPIPARADLANRLGFEHAVLSEVRMLLDFVASDPATSLSDLALRDQDDPTRTLDVGKILLRLDQLETNSAARHPLDSRDRSFLQLLRDGLVRKTRPASGLTIAYTSLVTGNLRGEGSESRATLASRAYPGLVRSAGLQRWMQRILLCLAVVVTGAAAWESAKVALGRSLLQSLNGLRTEQAAIALDTARLEASHDRVTGGPVTAASLVTGPAGQVDLAAFSLCNRPVALAFYLQVQTPPAVIPPDPRGQPNERLKIYPSAEERDACERDHVLGFKLSIVHADLTAYRENWAAMVGSVFAVIAWGLNLATRLATWLFPAVSAAAAPLIGADDVEFMIAPSLLVWGNYVLPVIFGLLGSLIFVILDFYNKMRESRLHPRDTLLGPVRLVLGLVTGACIGLFFSATEPATPGNAASLAASLTLSASGLAFLAGFGVEGVFTALDALVRQVFSGAARSGDR